MTTLPGLPITERARSRTAPRAGRRISGRRGWQLFHEQRSRDPISGIPSRSGSRGARRSFRRSLRRSAEAVIPKRRNGCRQRLLGGSAALAGASANAAIPFIRASHAQSGARGDRQGISRELTIFFQSQSAVEDSFLMGQGDAPAAMGLPGASPPTARGRSASASASSPRQRSVLADFWLAGRDEERRSRAAVFENLPRGASALQGGAACK